MEQTLKGRIDFVLLFDVQDGNPNGDPDAGNLPRIDAETGLGLVTDVCLKRKVRNYVQVAKDCAPGYDIFVKDKAVLDNLVEQVYADLQPDTPAKAEAKGKSKADATTKANARAELCRRFYDIRTFGAVIATTDKTDQVRGPIQLTFARSADRIVAQEHSITRMAVTKEADIDKERTMGRKATVPYGLYVCHGFISANLAKQTGFGQDDLALFWQALLNMFDCDRSAARGLMGTRRLITFRHDSELGNAPAHTLFDRVRVARTNPSAVARSFADYTVQVDTTNLPDGVEVKELL